MVNRQCPVKDPRFDFPFDGTVDLFVPFLQREYRLVFEHEAYLSDVRVL